MNLSIKSKILSGLFLIIFLFTLASYLIIGRIDSIKDHIQTVNTLYLPLSHITNELKSIDKTRGLTGIKNFSKEDFLYSFQHFSRFLSQNNSLHFIKSMQQMLQEFEKRNTYAAGTLESLHLKLLKLQTALENYNVFSKNAHTFLLRKEITKETAINKFLSLRGAFLWDLENFQRTINRKIQVNLLTTEKDGRSIILSLTLFLFIMSIIGIFIFIFSGASLKPLEDLYHGVKQLSMGDFSYRITLKESLFAKLLKRFVPFKASGNEIEALAHQFNQMSAHIQEHTKKLRRSERLATIGKISSEITHEIRNPLNSIALNLSLLEDETTFSKEQKILINSIQKEVDRLSSVTQSYLNYIKPINITLTQESINETIWHVYDLFKNELEKKNIKFHINIPSEDIVLPIDKEMLTQALINIVKNAIEALGNNTRNKEKTISINLMKQAEMYTINIKDNGPGIKEDDMDKIFLPFYTAKENGTGLGLGISYEIIEKMGGNLNCKSKPNLETTFSIEFPYEPMQKGHA